MYTFSKFTALKQRSVNKISITGSNSFNLPSKFYKDNSLGNYNYAILYYDSNNKAIGIQFTNDETEKSKLKIQKSNRGYGGFISATSFFKTNNIDTKIYKGRYDWKKETVENIGELYIIELKERGSASLGS